MQLKFIGKIRDPIYGDIHFTDFEKKIIDHPLFQRLRKVKQLGFLKYIFPSANHSRFEHSIGTMHLASEFLNHLLRNQSQIMSEKKIILKESSLIKKTLIPILKKKKTVLLLRIAALLHDIGHGPFSHASEVLCDQIDFKQIIKKIPQKASWLIQFFEKKNKNKVKITHEIIGYLLIYEFFSKEVPIKEDFLQEILCLLDCDFSLPKKSFLNKEAQLILNSFISSQADCDRMDYLLRDAYFTGVSYGSFDLKRILESICIIKDNCEPYPTIAFKENGVHALEHYLLCRYHMYLQIYTHKTNLAFESMMIQLLKATSLKYPLTIKDFLSFHDTSFANMIEDNLSDLHQQWGKKLLQQLFYKREPWKIIFSNSFMNQKKEKEYLLIKKKLLKSPYRKECFFYKNKKDFKKKPFFKSKRKQNKKITILKKSPLKKTYEIISLKNLSPFFNFFEDKEINLKSIYVNPKNQKEILQFLNKRDLN